MIKAEPFTLVHRTLRDRVNEYLLERDTALATLELLETCYCAVGHTHLPFICREDGHKTTFIEFTEDKDYSLEEERLIINQGSVGQPRGRTPGPATQSTTVWRASSGAAWWSIESRKPRKRCEASTCRSTLLIA